MWQVWGWFSVKSFSGVQTPSISCFGLFVWFYNLYLISACGIYFPEQGSNPGLLNSEQGVLAI